MNSLPTTIPSTSPGHSWTNYALPMDAKLTSYHNKYLREHTLKYSHSIQHLLIFPIQRQYWEKIKELCRFEKE